MGDEDITPEDPDDDTPLGTDEDDMDVIGSMATPFGAVNANNEDGVDNIVNALMEAQENDMMVDEINNDIGVVTAGGPEEVGDIHPPNADMQYLMKANGMDNDMEVMTAGGNLIDMNEGTDDEGSNDDYALEDDLIIDDDQGITIIDNEDAMKAKSMKQQEDFGQILGDDVMAGDMMMDDIVNDMDNEDEDEDELLAGMDTVQ